jgi:hypothetical protein
MNDLLAEQFSLMSNHDTKVLEQFSAQTIKLGFTTDQGKTNLTELGITPDNVADQGISVTRTKTRTKLTFNNTDPSNTPLAEYVRTAFFDMVTSVYWKHIKDGKLRRNSTAAHVLLYSVDVGKDTAHIPGLQDWDAVERFLSPDRYSWLIKICSSIDWAIDFCRSKKGVLQKAVSDYLNSHRLENSVLMLSSFIEAHEYAQCGIPLYLGEEEMALDTPEQVSETYRRLQIFTLDN